MKAIATPELNMRVTFEIDEREARFLDALVGYGGKELIRVVKEHLGEYYLKPYEKDGERFCETARRELGHVLGQFDKAREAFAIRSGVAPSSERSGTP